MATNYIEREAVLNILASESAPWDAYVKVSQLPYEDVDDLIKDIDSLNDEITALHGAYQALLDFANFVAKEVVVDGDEWAYNQFSFPELACRRLYLLGVIEEKDGKWKYEWGDDDG